MVLFFYIRLCMKKIKNITKSVKLQIFKVVATILSACGISSCFTACYGMPVAYGMPENYTQVSFRVTGDVDGNGTVDETEYVKGISVDCIDGDSSVTDENGCATLYAYGSESAKFEFSDENNVFETKTQTVDFSTYEESSEISVQLERKSSKN